MTLSTSSEPRRAQIAAVAWRVRLARRPERHLLLHRLWRQTAVLEREVSWAYSVAFDVNAVKSSKPWQEPCQLISARKCSPAGGHCTHHRHRPTRDSHPAFSPAPSKRPLSAESLGISSKHAEPFTMKKSPTACNADRHRLRPDAARAWREIVGQTGQNPVPSSMAGANSVAFVDLARQPSHNEINYLCRSRPLHQLAR
jgi:hypothetical protein